VNTGWTRVIVSIKVNFPCHSIPHISLPSAGWV
jgi:hypothetical protein